MQNNHLFLFDFVERGSNVIIYGLGVMGKAYIMQIEQTKWCNIIGVCDKEVKLDTYDNIEIDDIKKIYSYDYLIIAIESLRVASDVYYELTNRGINCPILNFNMRNTKFPDRKRPAEIRIDNTINIGIMNGGGFGDALIDMLLVSKLKELLGNICVISYACKNEEFFEKFKYVDIACSYLELNHKMFLEKNDLVIVMHSIPIIQKMNEEKVLRFSEKLYRYCVDCKKMYVEKFSSIANNYRFTKYALLLGKNRIEHLDIHNLLGISRYDKLEVPLSNEKSVLGKFNLVGKKYITVNRDSGSKKNTHTKLWPTEYYIKLLKKIKDKYNHFEIVLIGEKNDEHLFPYVDINLTAQTKLDEIAIILKNTILNISSEGGLVHLLHFLGGKSVCFFGPTDVKVFGYEENVNMYGDYCEEHCAWLIDNWDQKCILNYENPICMASITVNQIFDRIDEVLQG